MDYGVGQSMSRVGIILANQGDNLVVGRWLGAVPLGTYSRAYQLMAVPAGLLGDVLDKVLFPTMAQGAGRSPPSGRGVPPGHRAARAGDPAGRAWWRQCSRPSW